MDYLIKIEIKENEKIIDMIKKIEKSIHILSCLEQQFFVFLNKFSFYWENLKQQTLSVYKFFSATSIIPALYYSEIKSITVIEFIDQGNLREECFILAHTWRIQFVMERYTMTATGHTGTRQLITLCLIRGHSILFLIFIQSRTNP